ncbi:unnamed protein product [Lactuca saligna]|uniref:Uncharacterized protein n=1 Tax=Lactuca saligna TaxID=75948 RepID=A0AA35Z595_LACSI|nr:unnamed protein product [Lactuca saligna]
MCLFDSDLGKNKASSTGDEEQALESIESIASHINEITISRKPCVSTTTPSNSLESPCFLHQTQTDEETDEIVLTFESQLLQESNGRNIEKQQASKEDFPSPPPFSADSINFLAKSTVEKKTPVVDLKAINKQETSNPSRNVSVKTSSHITLSDCKENASRIYATLKELILGMMEKEWNVSFHWNGRFLNECNSFYFLEFMKRNNFVSPKVTYETATALHVQLDEF